MMYVMMNYSSVYPDYVFKIDHQKRVLKQLETSLDLDTFQMTVKFKRGGKDPLISMELIIGETLVLNPLGLTCKIVSIDFASNNRSAIVTAKLLFFPGYE